MHIICAAAPNSTTRRKILGNKNSAGLGSRCPVEDHSLRIDIDFDSAAEGEWLAKSAAERGGREREGE